MKEETKTEIQWSANFAYAVGLLVTDGGLSKDGRHIDFTSKDVEQVENLKKCLGVKAKIGFKSAAADEEKKYARVQFGDVRLYRRLIAMGLTPAKSLTLGKIEISDKYFFDFLRGHFDGDGWSYSYLDKRWNNSFMYYLAFGSASKKHIDWLADKILEKTGIKKEARKAGERGIYVLRFAKKAAKQLYNLMYYSDKVTCLSRKKRKLLTAIEHARVVKLVNTQA